VRPCATIVSAISEASRPCCFPEFTFRETTFQTFLCLFAIRKVGQRRTLSSQRKTLSGQRKTLSSQRKIWFSFQESVFPLCFLFEFLVCVLNYC